MYNSLVLAALLPLTGPTAGEHVASLPQPEKIQLQAAVDPGDHVPVLDVKKPVRATVAYAADAETPVPAWTPPVAAAPTTPVTPAAPIPSPAAPVSESVSPAAAAAPLANAPPTFAAHPSRPNTIVINGILEVPKWNDVELAANFQAQLMSLKTERKDAAGNTVLVPLREGMHVVEGQVLGNFDDRELRLSRKVAECEANVAKAEAEKLIEVKFAAIRTQKERASLGMLKEANSHHEGAISQMEVLQAELKVEEAMANFELQDYNLKVVKKAEYDAKVARLAMADVLIQLRQLVAPISGVIVKIEKAEGEWLREGDKVLQIVQLNTLRLKGRVNAKLYTHDMVYGKNVSITMPLVNGQTEEFPGKVVFADEKIVAGDEFEIFIEVQNRPSGNSWVMQPGRTVSATIEL